MATQFSVTDDVNWTPRFITIWTGQALSLLGSQLVQFALIWYLTVLTGSATVLATATLVGLLPRVLIGPLAGSLIDRWDRRKTMIVADGTIAAATLVLAVMFALDSAHIWQIYTLMFVRSVAGAFHGNSMAASTSLMVPVEHITRVQGFNQMLNGGLNVVSAPLGAILYELLSLQVILAIDVVSAVFAIAPLFFFEIPQPDRTVSEDLTGRASTVLDDFIAGFRYALSWRGLLYLSLMAAFLNFLLTPGFSLLPLFVSGHLGGDVGNLGAIEAIAGAGAIIGGALLGVWGGFERRIFTSMLGIFGIGAGTLVVGLVPVNGFEVTLAAMFLIGLSMPIANGALMAILQVTVSPDMQGRVFSLLGSLASGMAPIGLILAGPLAERLGIQTWFILAGTACLAMSLFGVANPTVRTIEDHRNDEPDQALSNLPITDGIATVE